VKLIDKYPDMVDKVTITALSPPIPTAPIVFRKGLLPDVVKKLEGAFLALNQDQNAMGLLYKMYGARGILKVREARYDGIRDILNKLGKELKEDVPGAVDFYKTHVWDAAPAP
jgi:ABC-type phosphate/phosphonate transport system substrate-binding protein